MSKYVADLDAGTATTRLTEQQTTVLQAIYDYFRAHAAWPAFIAIDRPIRRTHGWDTATIILSIPESLIVPPRPGGLRPIETDELRLRLQGIQACRGGAEDTGRFVRVLRWFAEREMAHEPQGDVTDEMPRITSAEVAQYLGIGDTGQLALKRLLLMLQLGNWGLGSSGSTEDSWYVMLRPDIWRFRDVRTVEDCAMAWQAWASEGRPPSQPTNEVVQTFYYHVRLTVKKPQRPSNRYRRDLSEEELESQILAPYSEGRAIVDSGVITKIEDLVRISIVQTDQPSGKLPSRSFSSTGGSYIGNNAWRTIVSAGEDVTNEFIPEVPAHAPPPTTVLAQQPSTPPQQPSTPPQSADTYISRKVIEAIRAKGEQSKLDVTKLLGLIDELNDNYAERHTYASHALLRAILDHVPPILVCADFAAVANNYAWGRTDRKYIKRLAEFRDQADDALHRQIETKPDVLGFEDMPASVKVERLLQECAEHL
jgi:hypothetical protein